MNALKHNEDDHEKFVDAFKVMRKDHAVIGRSGNFVVLYLKEPMIKISEQYRSTMFPKDFSEILEFYTSGSKVHSILKFFYVEGDKLTKQLLNHLKLLTSQRLRQLNFHLDIELNQVRSYDEVYEKFLSRFKALVSREIGGRLSLVVRWDRSPKVRTTIYLKEQKPIL